MASKKLAPGILGKSDVFKVDPDAIQIDPEWNTRLDYGDIESFARWIFTNGVTTLDPLVLERKKDQSLHVRDGHRRIMAIHMAREELGADIQYVPAFIRSYRDHTQADLMFEMISANEGKSFEPLELAMAYKRLNGWGFTQTQIAERMGKSQSHVAQTLKLCKATPELQQAVKDGKINSTEAREIIEGAYEADDPEEAQRQATDALKDKPKAQRRVSAKDREITKAIKLLREEFATNFGTYEQYRERRGDHPYSGAEMTAFLVGRLSIYCDMADADLADLETLLQDLEPVYHHRRKTMKKCGCVPEVINLYGVCENPETCPNAIEEDKTMETIYRVHFSGTGNGFGFEPEDFGTRAEAERCKAAFEADHPEETATIEETAD